ncbi:MAG: hypothetical protein VX363_03200, partial [Pseudomonadota bacterium]
MRTIPWVDIRFVDSDDYRIATHISENPGVVSDLVLLEPALLERASLTALRELRSRYAIAASLLLTEGDPIVGVKQFLDLISPNRSRH